jgi:hypothetical protein
MKKLLVVAVITGIVGAITLLYVTDHLHDNAKLNP